MNWYARYKTSQFVDYNALVNSIYQRLVQADRGAPAAENAADDVHSQGFDLTQIENAVQQAVYMIVGNRGEPALSDAQRHVVQTIRGGAMMGGSEPMDPSAGLGEGVQLNAV